MNIETTEAFLKVFEYLSEKFGITVDAANKNIVPYLQELGDKIVAYKHDIAWLWVYFGIVVGVIGLVLFVIGSIKDWDGFQWAWLIIGVGAAMVIIMVNAHTIIACNTFPEKIILDYIDTLMNGTNSGYR